MWDASCSRRVRDIFGEIESFGHFDFNDEDRRLLYVALEAGIDYRKISEIIDLAAGNLYDKVDAISDTMYDLEVKAGVYK